MCGGRGGFTLGVQGYTCRQVPAGHQQATIMPRPQLLAPSAAAGQQWLGLPTWPTCPCYCCCCCCYCSWLTAAPEMLRHFFSLSLPRPRALHGR